MTLNVGPKYFSDFVFSPEGSRLAAVNNDRTVRIWNTRTWEQEHAYNWQIGKLMCIDVAPDGLRYAAGSSTGKVIVWDAE